MSIIITTIIITVVTVRGEKTLKPHQDLLSFQCLEHFHNIFSFI